MRGRVEVCEALDETFKLLKRQLSQSGRAGRSAHGVKRAIQVALELLLPAADVLLEHARARVRCRGLRGELGVVGQERADLREASRRPGQRPGDDTGSRSAHGRGRRVQLPACDVHLDVSEGLASSAGRDVKRGPRGEPKRRSRILDLALTQLVAEIAPTNATDPRDTPRAPRAVPSLDEFSACSTSRRRSRRRQPGLGGRPVALADEQPGAAATPATHRCPVALAAVVRTHRCSPDAWPEPADRPRQRRGASAGTLVRQRRHR